MPASRDDSGPASCPTFLTPTSNNRRILPRKMQRQRQQSTMAPKQRSSNGYQHIRPLTVDEALQYSSLSSVVPHNPDIIPLPSISLPGHTSIISALKERSTSRQSLEVLDTAVLSRNSAPGLLDRTVRDLRMYLESDELTKFKFKASAGASDWGRQATPISGSASYHIPTPRLGPFADMILNSTDVAYRYPTPDTPGSRPLRGPNSPEQTLKELPSTPVSSQFITQNERAYTANGAIPRRPEQALNTPAVAIPVPPPSFDHSQYKAFPDDKLANRKDNSVRKPSRKRKYEEFVKEGDTIARIDDQKHKSDESLRSLQDLIRDIFVAEDQLQPDTSGTISLDVSKFFVLGNTAESNDHGTLASWAHSKLEAALQKVISFKRFAEVPLDQLTRIQKLCEGALSSAEATDLKIERDWSEHDIYAWLHRVELADAGLKSARTLLRTMVGGREEKQLYSEELLHTVLNVLKHVVDSCIVPVVEARSTGSNSHTFIIASSQQKPLQTLLHQASRTMRLLADLLTKVEVAESAVITIEFLVARLVFVENAHTEKESALGIQKVEGFRRNATDVLAKIFARYPDQRECIIGEILTSLEKLPHTRQSARQFKLIDGKNIQLVSALIMQLVQTSGAPPEERDNSIQKGLPRTTEAASNAEADGSETGDDGDERLLGVPTNPAQDTEEAALENPGVAVHKLNVLTQPLFESASKIADYIIKVFVQRALTSTKTGDQPYRNLLDIFTEDLLSVLSSTDWPAAELLLRCLLVRAIGIAESPSSTAPSKNMALELLGMMGSAISDVAAYVRQLAKTLEHNDSALSDSLVRWSEECFDGRLSSKALCTWEGPYRAVLQYLQARDLDDSQIRSARGFYLTQWAMGVCTDSRSNSVEDDGEPGASYASSGRLAFRLRNMMSGCRWIEAEDDLEPVSTSQARLGYGLTILNMGFCRAFERILKLLLESLSSEQATLRNRSLKSVVQMLEKDPTILDRGAYVSRLIVKCAADTSSMVRDSALALIGKCITIKPALEDDMCRPILACSADPAIGVRKRSMRLLRDIYLRNPRSDVKAIIAECLLQRAKDHDEGVSDLARQMFEEIWLCPFYKFATAADDSISDKLALKEQVTLVVQTVKRSVNVMPVLELLLRRQTLNGSKNGPANFSVCKEMVAAMFDGIIQQGELPQNPGQQHILQTLTVFAKANAKLFTAEQLQHLQPYVENLSSADDLLLFRAVVVIFRFVLPHVSVLQGAFLGEIQNALLKNLAKFAEAELNEVVQCLWTISSALNNYSKLVTASVSIIAGIPRLQDVGSAGKDQEAALKRVKNYMRIAGYIGKYWDLENVQDAFRKRFQGWKGNSVSGMMVDLITPYTNPEQPRWMRAMALGSIGLICQTRPQHFLKERTKTAFLKVVEEDDADFQKIVLSNLRDFFVLQEQRSEQSADPIALNDLSAETGRLTVPLGTSDVDSASATIAQSFLKPIIRIALANQDSPALVATEVLAAVNRQGLVHPKGCGPALVALETSTNKAIADIAFKEHQRLHQQHESIFEKEYMNAVQEAFIYQRDVVGDPNGAVSKGCAAKIQPLFDIIKTSKSKYQKKFLGNLCEKVNCDVNKLDVSAELPTHAQYARFIIENLAFFDYGRVDELLHTVSCMERVVTGTGAGITHAIGAELFKAETDVHNEEHEQPSGPSLRPTQPITAERLRQLATASVVLSMLWEARNFLRRAYGLNTSQQRRENKGKVSTKDANKAPTKGHGVTGDTLFAHIAELMNDLLSREAMMLRCQKFSETLALDDEIRILEADKGEDSGRFDTPIAEDEGVSRISPDGEPPLGKRKNSTPGEDTPKKPKKRGRPRLAGKKNSAAGVIDEEAWH